MSVESAPEKYLKRAERIRQCPRFCLRTTQRYTLRMAAEVVLCRVVCVIESLRLPSCEQADDPSKGMCGLGL
eukprot:scaffold2324_cov266-Pinguiococcus_pyrenoidosus.AAC.3